MWSLIGALIPRVNHPKIAVWPHLFLQLSKAFKTEMYSFFKYLFLTFVHFYIFFVFLFVVYLFYILVCYVSFLCIHLWSNNTNVMSSCDITSCDITSCDINKDSSDCFLIFLISVSWFSYFLFHFVWFSYLILIC